MPALLYFTTAAAILFAIDRWVARVSRGAAIALLLLPLVFTGGALLTGRVYAPLDVAYLVQPLKDHRGIEGIGEPKNPMLSDIAVQMIPWREAVRRSIAERSWPLLDRYELCGDMLAGSAQPAAFSPFTWIALLLPSALSFTFTAAIAFFIAGLGTFLLARELGCGELAAAFSAATWMFSAPIALQILWPLGFAWTLLPFVLLAARRVIERTEWSAGVPPAAVGRPRPAGSDEGEASSREAPLRSIHPVALLTLALVLEIVAGHPETLLHVVAIGASYAIFELVARRSARPVLPLLASGILALLVGAIAILPFVDALRQTAEYAARSGAHAHGSLNVLTGHARVALTGDLFPFLREWSILVQRSEAGSLALALAAVALWRRRSRYAWFFASLGFVCLLAGTNAWPVAQVLHRLPLFDVTVNDRLAAAVPLCIAILAGFAIDRLPRREALVAMLALSALIAGAALWRAPLDRVRFVAELAPLTAAIAAVWFMREPRFVLLALLLVQRVASDGALVPVYEARAAYPPLALFKPLASQPEPFRIAGRGQLLLPNTATMYGLEDVRASSAMTFAPLADTFPLWLERAGGQFDAVRDLRSPFVAMVNLKYALLDVSDPIPAGWHDVTFDIYTRLIENEHVLPRAFVPRVVRIGGVDDVAEMGRETDFASRGWIAAAGPRHEEGNGPGRVTARWREGGLDLQATMDGAGFVVVSQADWRGWRARLDGRRVQTRRANHAFIGIWLPAGEHSVRLVFQPQSFMAGRAITLATLLLLGIVGIVRRVGID